MTPELETKLEQIVRAAGSHNDGAHDISHIRRVRKNALAIAAHEPEADTTILLAAVWLHDLVQVEKSDPRRAEASRLSAEASAPILTGWSWKEADVAKVAHAIEAHSFSAGIEPRSIEAKILRDADRLDAIGAIGIARVFSISGRLGRLLYDDTDPTAAHRALNDGHNTLDHFHTKLFKLGDGMLTEKGRAMAAERIAFMRGYVARFLEEVG